VQLTRPIGSAVLALSLAGSIGAGVASATPADEAPVSTLLRIFNDSQHIAVRSMMGDYRIDLPRDYALGLHLNNERVTIRAIQAPPGSAEAVDAITTASRPISGNAFQDFVKVRNELQSGLSSPHAGVEYYYSTESDYLGQQLAAHADRDFLDRQVNLSVGTSYGWDAITPLADDDTRTGNAHKQTLHWNAVATEALTPATLVRVGVEYNIVRGLQHNPYRNVYAGGTIVPERHPDHRERRDAFVKLNQYFENRSSLRLHYRFYQDDWGILSHEAGTRLSQYLSPGLSAQYEYRYYTQGAADFYRDLYASVAGINGYLSGDYRMAALSSHLFGVALDFDWAAMAPEVRLLNRLGMRLDWERYFNSNNYSANLLETGLSFRF
jgi:hypothetical protein